MMRYLEALGIDTSDQNILEYLLGNSIDSANDENLIEKLIRLGVDPDDAALISLTDYMSHKGISTIPTLPAANEPDLTNNLLETSHRMPLKVGLSVRTPLAEKLYLTTGLDYSRYASVYTYSQSSEIKTFEHYLGIPLRLDWMFASSKRFDLYAGAGMQAEWCLAGSEGFSTSLLGAGGVQFNLTDWLGVYAEPQLSWKMSIDKPTATTYRSEHPLMFAVATGIRININRF